MDRYFVAGGVNPCTGVAISSHGRRNGYGHQYFRRRDDPCRSPREGIAEQSPEVSDGGRTDSLATDVRQSSYVIPTDIVSWLGQGDTAAGYRVLTHMFGPHSPGHARLGEKTVPVMVAGGEFIVSPAAVTRVGRGDIRAGHDALDHWVKMERRKIIMKLKSLPGPKRD
jgi:hypothetical protein